MASREERMQQRLRGAQRRQVKDVDFGLSIPVAPESAPQEPAAQIQHLLRLDLSPHRSPPPTKGHKQHWRTPTDVSAKAGIPYNDANTSAKRRRLNIDLPSVSSETTTRSLRTIPRPDIYTLVDDGQLETADETVTQVAEISVEDSEKPSLIQSPRSARSPRPARTPVPTLQSIEITESPRDAPGSGHRMHVNLHGPYSADSLVEGLRSPINSDVTELETPLRPKKPKRPASSRRLAHAEPALRRSAQSFADENSLDELSPDQLRQEGGKHNASIQFDVEEHDPISDPQQEDQAESFDDITAAALLEKYRVRRHLSNVPEPSPDLGETEESSTVIGKKKRRNFHGQSPFQQRQPKHKATKAKKIRLNTNPRAGSPIPVTVHRLTKVATYGEEQLDVNILNSEVPRMHRVGVNAIDVLSQVCAEQVDITLERLQKDGINSDDVAVRREYTTKRRAVELFGEQLQTRLIEHTINLDNTYSLERRVKDEQRKVVCLRGEILRIRTEREQVALRKDDIRIRHENEMKDSQDRDALNTAVHDIELAADFGKKTELVAESGTVPDIAGIELVIKRVTGDVGNKGGMGGSLSQFKAFNAFLERSALALESTRA